MNPRRRYRVGVVGFGIAGAATAYLLARGGHSVTLLERASHVGPIGAGLLLQPAGQAVLRRMGLLDHVVADAAPIDELHAVHPDGLRSSGCPTASSSRGARPTASTGGCCSQRFGMP